LCRMGMMGCCFIASGFVVLQLRDDGGLRGHGVRQLCCDVRQLAWTFVLLDCVWVRLRTGEQAYGNNVLGSRAFGSGGVSMPWRE
jgi:hypothetical protein